MKQIRLVAAYLVAIVLANLTAAWWGPQWTIINALLFIGLDLTARDGLHETWGRGRQLWFRMAALIGFGSLLSWLLNRGSGRIALASFLAFSVAGVVDTVVYTLASRLAKHDRVNASNIASAVVDSILFPTIAFGSFMLDVTIGQFGAKVAGGAIWLWIIFGWKDRQEKKKSAVCEWCGEGVLDDMGPVGSYHDGCVPYINPDNGDPFHPSQVAKVCSECGAGDNAELGPVGVYHATCHRRADGWKPMAEVWKAPPPPPLDPKEWIPPSLISVDPRDAV